MRVVATDNKVACFDRLRATCLPTLGEASIVIKGIGSPWYVGRVELKLDQGQGAVHVYVNHQLIQTWSCGECGQPCALYDHQPERQWRHLDTCQYRSGGPNLLITSRAPTELVF